METTRRHTISSSHTHIHMSVPMYTPQHSVKLGLSTLALEGMLNVLYVQVTDAAVDVHTSAQKTAKRRRTKEEIEKKRGIFFSWGAYAALRTGLCFHLREREGEGGKALLPYLHQFLSRSPWSHSQPWRSPQAKAG